MELMNLEELISAWEKDAPVNETEPSREIIRIPSLHSKYAAQAVKHSLALKAKKTTYDKLRKIKYEYYSGKMSEEELAKRGWEAFRFVLKGDMEVYMSSDPDLQEIKAKIYMHEEATNFCGFVLKELGNRTFELRAYMDWETKVGGHN
jgi:hypothetical protein